MPSEGNGPIRPSLTRLDRPLRAVSRHSYGTETLGSRLTPRLFGPTIGRKTGRRWIRVLPGATGAFRKNCANLPENQRRAGRQSELSPQFGVKKRAARPNAGRVGKSTTLDKGHPPALASFYTGGAGLHEFAPTRDLRQRPLAESALFMEFTSARCRLGLLFSR